MPINLEDFRRIANSSQSNIRLSSHNPEVVKTRGSFRAWIASRLNLAETRAANSAVAHEFLASLRNHAQALPSSLDGSDTASISKYSARVNLALEKVVAKLELQRSGAANLTSADVRGAIRLIDDIKAEAASDIGLDEAETVAEEAAYVSELLSSSSNDPAHPTPGDILRKYLDGQPVSHRERSSINRFLQHAVSISQRSTQALRKLEETALENERPEDRASRERAASQLRNLGPALNVVNALSWFVDADYSIEEYDLKANDRCLSLGDNQHATSSRSAKEIALAANGGAAPDQRDLEFLRAWKGKPSGVSAAELKLHFSRNELSLVTEALDKADEAGLARLRLPLANDNESLEFQDSALDTSRNKPIGPISQKIRLQLEKKLKQVDAALERHVYLDSYVKGLLGGRAADKYENGVLQSRGGLWSETEEAKFIARNL